MRVFRVPLCPVCGAIKPSEHEPQDCPGSILPREMVMYAEATNIIHLLNRNLLIMCMVTSIIFIAAVLVCGKVI